MHVLLVSTVACIRCRRKLVSFLRRHGVVPRAPRPELAIGAFCSLAWLTSGSPKLAQPCMASCTDGKNWRHDCWSRLPTSFHPSWTSSAATLVCLLALLHLLLAQCWPQLLLQAVGSTNCCCKTCSRRASRRRRRKSYYTTPLARGCSHPAATLLTFNSCVASTSLLAHCSILEKPALL